MQIFINNQKLSVALLYSLITPLACFSMQTTIEMLPDERIEDIIIYSGKNNLKELSSTACVNKQWNAITNSPYVTKLLFINSTHKHTAGSKYYHAINNQLHTNIENKDAQKVIELLEDPFINPNYETEWNAISYEDIKSNRVMLESIKPLHRASLVCDKQSINSLLHAKAHITGTRWSPLNLVIASNPERTTSAEKQLCIQTLLEHKANIQQECSQCNGLHIAAIYGDSTIIPFLGTHITGINTKNYSGEIPLLTLLKYRHNHNKELFMYAAHALIDANSDIHAQDRQGHSALTYTNQYLIEESMYHDIGIQLLDKYNQN